jgi:hypothetical protein
MMKRRDPVKGTAAALIASDGSPRSLAGGRPGFRVRPGDPGWPPDAGWEQLSRDTGGRLIKISSPLAACRNAPDSPECRDIFKELMNPYYIGDDPALTQTTGRIDPWTAQPGVYAVAAESANDVAAAVNFARDNNLRLVVKGGGHSYLGTSSAPDSLLIWTRRIQAVTLHDAFVPQGCEGIVAPQHAVTTGAGAIWRHTYNEVTTKGGRYVQGGGCLECHSCSRHLSHLM